MCMQAEDVVRYLSAKTRERGDLPASVAVLAARLTQRWHRAQAAPLSIRNAHKHKVCRSLKWPLGKTSCPLDLLPAVSQPSVQLTNVLCTSTRTYDAALHNGD